MKTIFSLMFNRVSSRVSLPHGEQALGAKSPEAIKAQAAAYAAKNPQPRAMYTLG